LEEDNGMRVKLTDKFLNGIKLPQGGAQMDVWDATLPGFGVRVGARKKTFMAMLYVSGKKRRITLGEYGPGGITLADARKKAGEADHAAEKGDDPAVVVGRRPAARDGKKIGDLVPEFVKLHCMKKNKDWKNQQGIFERDVLPYWRNRLATSIKRRDCIELLDRAAERTSDTSANRVRAHLSNSSTG
jgi:hypothetical protein